MRFIFDGLKPNDFMSALTESAVFELNICRIKIIPKMIYFLKKKPIILFKINYNKKCAKFVIVVTQKLVLQQSKNVTAKCTEIPSPPPCILYLLEFK